jgi:pyridinium-3,5-bisthiocarboxylic acid mononucleotide nickel chelatase
MKCLYFDCFAGISGDMTLGALVDLGVPLTYLTEQLGRLSLSGYRICSTRALKMGISGKKVTVQCGSREHHHEHNHQHRSFSTIESLIKKSSLKQRIKDQSRDIFFRLASAEAHIHRQKVADVYFHEVGAVDSIVDIVGSVLGLDYLGIETCFSSALPLGSGFVQCQHGTLPVPAPATLELLRGVSVYQSDVKGEMVTPTGAAILTTLAKGFGVIPPLNIIKVGYGAGSNDFAQLPNMLRVILGEAHSAAADGEVWVLEANIDDMNPEFAGFLMEQLLDAGALDVAFIPLYMKKNRPGTMLQVICDESRQPHLLNIIFRESTTAGVRYHRAARAVLQRSHGTLKTSYGTLKVKIFGSGANTAVAPEFEECRRIALQKGVPLKEVYAEVIVAGKRNRPARP